MLHLDEPASVTLKSLSRWDGSAFTAPREGTLIQIFDLLNRAERLSRSALAKASF